MGGTEFVFVILGLVTLGVVIWEIIDAASRPDYAWQRVGQNKVVWIAVPAVGLFLCGIVSLIMAIIYFSSIRPRLIAAQESGGYGL